MLGECGVGWFRRIFGMGMKASDSSGLTNRMKLDLKLGVLRMGCIYSTERNERDLYPSRSNLLRNRRYKVNAEILRNAG